MKLTSAQDAIKQAYGTNDEPKYSEVCEILLSPEFWQALGEARGWKKKFEEHAVVYPLGEWQKHALKWFSVHMADGDEQKFWESLP